MKAELAYQSDNHLGEGIIWSPRHSMIQWTDILGQKFWQFDPVRRKAKSVQLDKRLCCFAALGASRLLAGFDDGLYDFDYESGQMTSRFAIETDLTTTRIGLNPEALRASPLSGSLFVWDTGVVGLVDHEFGM